MSCGTWNFAHQWACPAANTCFPSCCVDFHRPEIHDESLSHGVAIGHVLLHVPCGLIAA
jgi:hypothetical protein